MTTRWVFRIRRCVSTSNRRRRARHSSPTNGRLLGKLAVRTMRPKLMGKTLEDYSRNISVPRLPRLRFPTREVRVDRDKMRLARVRRTILYGYQGAADSLLCPYVRAEAICERLDPGAHRAGYFFSAAAVFVNPSKPLGCEMCREQRRGIDAGCLVRLERLPSADLVHVLPQGSTATGSWSERSCAGPVGFGAAFGHWRTLFQRHKPRRSARCAWDPPTD